MGIAVDCTGSMSSVLATVRRNLQQLLQQTFGKHANIRISIMFFGDYCDPASDQI